MKRRNFINASLAVSTALILPIRIKATDLPNNEKKKLRFGICADVHKDIMHDGDSRLEEFIDEALEQNFDFIIQLGDFCRPYDYNQDFMSIWNRFPGKKYHVLGNHDTDGGFTHEQVVKYWNAEGQYYSFDFNGFHFIVLNGNELDPSPDRPSGYARFMSDKQLDWLEQDLQETALPTFVFCHQGMDNDLGGISNATKSRLVLERANKTAGFQKVKVVFSGHHHQDYHNIINDIDYIQINSMSYQWLGNEHQHLRYSKEVDKEYPWIKYTVPYKNPIWAIVEVSTNSLEITGRKTEFVGPSPEELGMDENSFGYPIVPLISDRKIKL